MNMVEIIEKKKFGQSLSAEEIDYFVKGAADGSIPDYQLSALLMAIRLNGMNREETVQLTLSMAHSGDMMDLSMLEGRSHGQALHRRRGRHHLAGAGPAGGRLRRARGQDERPRTGTHRRYAGQAGKHLRLPHRT